MPARKRHRAEEATPSAPPRLIFAYLDPENGRLACGFESGKVVRLPLKRLGLPKGARVAYASVDEFRAGIDFVREDGTRTDCGADLIPYLTDRQYRAQQRRESQPREAFAGRVGANLITIRRQLSLSQREMARRLDMAAPNYARLESGRHALSSATLLRISKALRRPIADLLV